MRSPAFAILAWALAAAGCVLVAACDSPEETASGDDAGPALTDAGPESDDAGGAETDAGGGELDAGSQLDAGSPATDGGAVDHGGCQVMPEHITDPAQRALFQPAALAMQQRSWEQLWGPGFVYPNGRTGEPYPVGSWTLSGNVYSPAVSLRGKYITVPFVGDGRIHEFLWIQAKPVSSYRYQPTRPTDFMYVTISTCPGDFRLVGEYQTVAPDPVNDPTMVRQCRNRTAAETLITYGPSAGCRVEAGRTYYLNIVFADPSDGLTADESGCRDTDSGVCETSWRHR